MKKVDLLLYALYSSSYASLRLSSLLPSTDICEEIKEILLEQCGILSGMIEGDRFKMQELEDFIEQCEEVAKQAEALDAVQE